MWIFYAALFFGILAITFKYSTIIGELLSERWYAGPILSRFQAEISERDTRLFTPMRELLEAQSFSFQVCFNKRHAQTPLEDGFFESLQVFYNDDLKVFAFVTPKLIPEGARITEVTFISFFEEGKHLVTMLSEQEKGFVAVDSYEYQAPEERTLEKQYHLHQEALKMRIGTMMVPDTDELMRLYNDARNRYLEQAIEAGILHEGPPAYMSLWQALRYVIGSISHEPCEDMCEKEHPEYRMAQEAHDVYSYHAYTKILNRKQSLRSGLKVWMALLSTLVFLIIFAILFDPFISLIVVGAVLFHELGHFVAMWLMGYQHLHVLLIPLLGGVAVGEKPAELPAWKEVLVYMAGPIPGIVLASLLYFWDWGVLFYPENIETIAFFLLVINLFNLLPITPLDGGRVWDLLLFSRWPFAKGVFSLLSIVLLTGVAWISEDWLLMVCGIIFFSGLRVECQMARVLKSFYTGYHQGQEAVACMCAYLYQAGFESWSFARKFVLLKAAERGVGKAALRPLDMFLGFAVYAIALATIPLSFFGIYQAHEARDSSRIAELVTQYLDQSTEEDRLARLYRAGVLSNEAKLCSGQSYLREIIEHQEESMLMLRAMLAYVKESSCYTRDSSYESLIIKIATLVAARNDSQMSLIHDDLYAVMSALDVERIATPHVSILIPVLERLHGASDTKDPFLQNSMHHTLIAVYARLGKQKRLDSLIRSLLVGEASSQNRFYDLKRVVGVLYIHGQTDKAFALVDKYEPAFNRMTDVYTTGRYDLYHLLFWMALLENRYERAEKELIRLEQTMNQGLSEEAVLLAIERDSLQESKEIARQFLTKRYGDPDAVGRHLVFLEQDASYLFLEHGDIQHRLKAKRRALWLTLAEGQGLQAEK